MSKNLENILNKFKERGMGINIIKSENAIRFKCMQYGNWLCIIEISDNKYQIVKYKKNKTYVIEVQYLLSYNSDGGMNVVNTFNAKDIVDEAIQKAISYEDP